MVKKRGGRRCAICERQTGEGCATFLGLLTRWGIFCPPMKVNQFAHPSCVQKEQLKRRNLRG